MVYRFAGRITVFCHDTELGPSDLGKFSLRKKPKISVISIPPLTFRRRSLLIEKWLKLSSDFGKDIQAAQRKESECHYLVNTIIGCNYIQPFPPYVLAILQSIESGREVDISASTHGHLYEVFIKTALSKRSTLTNYNVITAFIATLAIVRFFLKKATPSEMN